MTDGETDIAEVRRQIGQGKIHVDKLSDQITKLDQAKQDSSEARALLIRLNDAQQVYVELLSRLEKNSELAAG